MVPSLILQAIDARYAKLVVLNALLPVLVPPVTTQLAMIVWDLLTSVLLVNLGNY